MNPMNRQRPLILRTVFALAAGAWLLPQGASADGSTDDIYYLTGDVTWTQNHVYDDRGINTYLCVGTGAGEGHLSVQEGARVEVAGALFIAGKGYGSPYSIAEGHDGFVTVGPGSTLECGSQTSAISGGHIYVGWGSGVKGTLRVDGGELISNYMLHVGCHEASDGLMEVVNGGRITLGLSEQISDADSSFLSIATAAGSHGLLRVSEGSTLAFAAGPGERTRADIGTGGKGTLLVEGGGRVSLGQDYTLIGVESGSQGLVHVRDGGLLELANVTYMALESNSRGEIVVEGSGSRLTGKSLSVGEAGEAAVTLREGAVAELEQALAVGIRSGSGRVEVASGSQLATTGVTQVGGRGTLQVVDGGVWVSSAPVSVESGGLVALRGQARWEAQAGAEFQPGSTLSFVVDSPDRVPEMVVAAGSALTLSAGSRLKLALSSELLQAVVQNGLDLPLVEGDVVGEGYTYELLDESGLLSSSGFGQLDDGRWGLSVTLDRAAVQRTLADDAARLANGLWSSTGVMSDYTAALWGNRDTNRRRHLWGMGLGSFSRLSSQGSTPGFDYNGGGYAIGADAPFSERTVAGISFGQVYGSNKSGDGLTRIRQNSLMGSLYARYDSYAGDAGRRMVLDAYAAYGRVHNRARSSMYSTGAERSSGRWWDDVYALGVRASWEVPLTEHGSLLPFIGLRYIHGSHGSLTMVSAEQSRGYGSASLHNLSLPIGFTLRGRYQLKRGQELLPELALAYVWDVSRSNPRMSAAMLGEEARSGGAAPGRHALMLRAGAAWMMNEHWSAGLHYHWECRRHEVGQAVDMSVSYGF